MAQAPSRGTVTRKEQFVYQVNSRAAAVLHPELLINGCLATVGRQAIGKTLVVK